MRASLDPDRFDMWTSQTWREQRWHSVQPRLRRAGARKFQGLRRPAATPNFVALGADVHVAPIIRPARAFVLSCFDYQTQTTVL